MTLVTETSREPVSFTEEQIAEACHEANRVLQRALGDPVSPPWAEAGEHARESAFSGVRFALRGGTPEQQHAEWMRHKAADGWKYGPVKDEQARTHPCMIPYGQLPAGQHVKDAVFIAVARAMTSTEMPRAAQPDDEYRLTAAGKARAEAVRYAFVEQLGHRSMVGITREITFCGKTMLEVQRIDVVPSVTVRVNPDTFYDVTDLSPEQAVAMARAYGRSTNGLDPAGVVTRAIREHRQLTVGSSPWHEDNPDDEDVDEPARELSAEGNPVAMPDTERDEYDRDGEALLDAQEEAAELASVHVGDDQ